MPLLSIFDRYTLKVTMTPLLAGAIVGIMAPLCIRLTLFLDLALSKRSGFSTIFQLLALWIPHYLGVALPLALYLGLLVGFDRLVRDNEIAAMQASGVGLHRIFKPVIALSAVCCVISFFVISWIGPYTVYVYRVLINDLKQTNTLIFAEGGIFMQNEEHTFLIESVSRSENRFERLFVFTNHPDAGPETITAEYGIMVPGENGAASNLQLMSGVAVRLDDWPTSEVIDIPPSARAVEFQRLDTVIGDEDSLISIGERGQFRHREWFLTELVQAYADPDAPTRVSRSYVISETHYRIAKLVLAWFLPFLALPFVTGGNVRMRYARFGVATIAAVVMYQLITQAEFISRVHGTSPYLITWLPMGIFAVLVMWNYWLRCFVVRRGITEALVDRLLFAITSPKQKRDTG